MNSDEKKNYMYSVIYRISICILPLIVTPYVARVLGAEQVGIYSFTSTVASFFILLGKMGLDNYGTRSIASCKEESDKRSRVFWGIYIMQMLTSIASIFVFILLILTAVKENQIIYWIQLIYVASVLFDMSWFFYGMEEFRITTIRSIISKTLIIIFVFIFVHSQKDLWMYTCIMSSCFMLEQLQLIPFMIKRVKWVKLKREDIVCHIVPNIKLFIPLLLLSIYNWLDMIMLGVMLPSVAVVAFYTYAENIINLPRGVLSALDMVMLPKISKMASNNHIEESVQNMKKAIRFNSFIGCALCFGVAGVSAVFVPWFLGMEFTPVVPLVMALAMIMIIRNVVNAVQTQYFIPFHQENIYIRAVTLGVLTDIILNLILIPLYGAFGAVISTLGTEVVVLVYQMICIKHVYTFPTLFKTLLPFIICGFFEFVATYLLGKLSMDTFLLLTLQIFAGGVVYLVGCGIYVIFISKEYRNLKEIINIIRL